MGYTVAMTDIDHTLTAFDGLRDRDYAREGLMVLEGRLVIQKALDCGVELVSLVTVPADAEEWSGRAEGRFPVVAVERARMADIVGFGFHRGALALARRPVPMNTGNAMPGNALLLWNVTDPDNLGALARSAVALGAKTLYLGPGCADPYSRKTLRTSMGCVLQLPLIFLPDTGSTVGHGARRRTLRADERAGLEPADIDTLAVTVPGTGTVSGTGTGGCAAGNLLVAAALVDDAVGPDLVAARAAAAGRSVTLVLGNEGWGLPARVAAAADYRVTIPMAEAVDSLNVAAAGAILMWELFRAGRV